MMKRLDHPSKTTWRFNGSEYTFTSGKGNFNQGKVACSALGMHLWYPNSQEELQFFETRVLCDLCYMSKDYYFVDDYGINTIAHNFWMGIIDRPNGNCLLADEVTRCSVKNYLPGQPNLGYQECPTYYWKNGAFGWDDSACSYAGSYGFCEKEI